MVAPRAEPTRRERTARWLYRDVIPPRGEERASRAGVSVALVALLALASAFATALGESAS